VVDPLPTGGDAGQQMLIALLDRFTDLYGRLTSGQRVPDTELDGWMLDAIKATTTGFATRPIAVPGPPDMLAAATRVAAQLAVQHGVIISLPA
jgi:hypothetical protein